MQARIDATVQFQRLYDQNKPALINMICKHLNDTYYVVQHETNQRDKSYFGIRARVISTTISLMCHAYQDYLLRIEVLNSDFFILVRDVIMRSFNETRHELISEDEKKLLKPVCAIVLKIADSMTPELANCNMILLFFGKTFVLSMTEGLKAFAASKLSYGADQKALIIKAILSMFSGYCVAKGDEAVSNEHVIGLVNAALCCVSSPVYLCVFNHHLQLMCHPDALQPENELFLEVCPKYVISYKKARREPMLTETKHAVVKNASNILHQVVPRIHETSPYLLKCTVLLIELLLLIPPNSFNLEPNMIKDLLNIVQIDKNDSNLSNEIKKLIQRSISLIYTLITDANRRKIFIQILSENDTLHIFEKLSLTSSDKHVRFTSALINWTLDEQNMADRQFSLKMIETFVHYLNECGEDASQQYNGVPLDSIMTTLTGLVENESTQQELIQQDAVPVIVKYAIDTEFDVPNIQQPSLECLWAMVFTPEVFKELTKSPKFLDHLKMLLATATTTTGTIGENTGKSLEELATAADGLLFKLEQEPILLSKQKPGKEFEYDIMISYQRQDEEICKKIVSQLTSQNKFRVWFDLDDMYGPIMTRMAEGIQKAEFVLIATSKSYETSRYCRSEATYAFSCNRNIIPLKLHGNYKVTGWLAMILSDLLYIDFSDKQPFNVAYKELIDQIAHYRQLNQSDSSAPVLAQSSDDIESIELEERKGSPEPVPEKKSVPSSGAEPPQQSLIRRIKVYVNQHFGNKKPNNNDAFDLNNSTTSVPPSQTISSHDTPKQNAPTERKIYASKQMKDWTHNDTIDFLHEHQLEKFTELLSDVDGTDLYHLHLMGQESSNKLFEHIKECSPEINLRDYLRFIKAIENYIRQEHTNN